MQGIFKFIEVSIFIVKDILWSWNDGFDGFDGFGSI